MSEIARWWASLGPKVQLDIVQVVLKSLLLLVLLRMWVLQSRMRRCRR